MIEARRKREEERKKRIFDPKTRIIGIDKDALDQQVRIKKEKADEDKMIDRQFDELMISASEAYAADEREYMDKRRAVRASVDGFNKQIPPETRREFDIYDPKILQKDRVIRDGDYDKTLGISSGQVFGGEDLKSKQRSLLQKRQQAIWLARQIEEKEEKERQRKGYEKEVADRERMELEDMQGFVSEHEHARRHVREGVREFNEALAIETAQRRLDDKLQKEKEEADHVKYVMESDLMCERYETTVRPLNPLRSVPYNFKGMTETQRKAIRDAQLKQIEEKKQTDEREKRREREWAEQTISMEEQLERTASQIHERKKQYARDLQAQILQQKEEQAQTAKKMKEIYDNKVTDDFYSKFSSSSR
ncbi:RIB43A like protein [Aduncisulcus paluster]|uniref:RIB43A like protein n=1 Tax=Aduncisulcus paluster TaxID=2918883 RepID=A0ABQ5JRY9_9EUKA|nr:RIB43A like protein [Aduncisulcus paluster]